MKPFMKKLATSGLLVIVGLWAQVAQAQSSAPTMVWEGQYSDKAAKDRMGKYDLPTFTLASGRKILNTSPSTRLETELQTTVALEDLGTVEQMMDTLVADQGKTETLLGKGYSIVRLQKAPRQMADPYYDLNDALARSGASLRIRIENGVAKVNFKPPTAVRFANGVAHRIEAGITVTLDANGNLSEDTIRFLENGRLKDNPLREWKKYFPRVSLRKVLQNGPVVALRQQRAIYEVQHEGTRVNELSVDEVTATDPKTGNVTKFGSFEGEGDHMALTLSPAQQAKLKNTTWKGPHKAKDTTHPAMMGTQTQPGVLGADASTDVKQVHMVAEQMQKYLQQNGRAMLVPASGNKYVRSRERLGMSFKARR